MYNSLKNVCSNFHLYIFAFDDKADSLLRKLQLEYVTVISLSEFEDDALLSVKEIRNIGEYCWTCTSSTIFYCIQHFQLSHCTYIDADLYFFSDPKVLIDEMGDNDVLITAHRYTPGYDLTSTSGKYCVQFMTFRNNENGMKILKWWRNACLVWCFARYEDGKFGDQKYLDDWTTRFTGIHELEHLGGGVAPWNMQQYSFQKQDSKCKGIELATSNSFYLVFFHFHVMHSYKKGIVREFYLCGYPLSHATKKYIYLPYLFKLKKQFRILKRVDKQLDGLATQELKITWWKYGKAIVKLILKKDNKYTFWLE
ncbi:MAG: glycosyl transferase [Bacteroidia bacterium]|nr:glycosyl transferase [Bacteroidia bacterium]